MREDQQILCPQTICPDYRMESLLWRDFVNRNPGTASLPRFHQPPCFQRYFRPCPPNSLYMSRCSGQLAHFDWNPYEDCYDLSKVLCCTRYKDYY